MPNACGYSWSGELDAIIREESAAAGVPLDLAYTFIAVESGFDPRARAQTPQEDSVGLLQLNRLGGQGQGYTVAQLMDPRFNLRVGLPPIRRAYEQSLGLDAAPVEFIYQVATRSGHPGLIPRTDPRMLRIVTTFACFHHGAGGTSEDAYPWFVFVPSASDWVALGTVASLELAAALGPFILAGTVGAAGVRAFAAALARGTGRRFIGSLSPRTLVRGQLRALTPAGLRRRFVSAIDPRAQLERAFRLPYPFAMDRLPPGHRHPRH